MSRQGNQYKTVPDDILRPHLEYAVTTLGLNNTKILEYLKGKYDEEKYSLSLATIKRRRDEWKLPTSRKQAKDLTIADMSSILERVRKEYPDYGTRAIMDHIRLTEKIAIPRDRIYAWFHEFHPEDLKQRQSKKFIRKQFVAAGVNHLWCFDQHDKWRRFGLWLHIGLEPFSGKILWLKVWWTNSNPRLICGWYLDVVAKVGGVPLISQSDGGTENNGIANAQTAIRHYLKSFACKHYQHKVKRGHNNIKPEIEWSFLRRYFTSGFQAVMEQGHEEDWYDPTSTIDELLWRWLTIPWIQKELDVYRLRHNSTARRKNDLKLLPHGIPDLIFNEPEKYGALDFEVIVPMHVIEDMRARYAPTNHEVFQLVPLEFDKHVRSIWIDMGEPVPNQLSLWNIFTEIKQLLTTIRIPQNMFTLQESGWNGGDNDALDLPRGLVQPNIYHGIPLNLHPKSNLTEPLDGDLSDDVSIFANLTDSDNLRPDGIEGDYDPSATD